MNPAVQEGTPPAAATLTATALLDSDHPDVVAFAREHARGSDDRERSVSLLYAVRDGFRYDPYRIDLSPHGMRASSVLHKGYGWCVPKAALLVAAARAAGIHARVGFADVRNHLSTERMRQTMKTDLFIWHGYADLWIEGRWVKATPAFNIELCQRFNLLPLDFDGIHDSLYHEFDAADNRHMEYVQQRGAFDDVPLNEIAADFKRVYAGWMLHSDTSSLAQASFEHDVQRENR